MGCIRSHKAGATARICGTAAGPLQCDTQAVTPLSEDVYSTVVNFGRRVLLGRCGTNPSESPAYNPLLSSSTSLVASGNRQSSPLIASVRSGSVGYKGRALFTAQQVWRASVIERRMGWFRLSRNLRAWWIVIMIQ